MRSLRLALALMLGLLLGAGTPHFEYEVRRPGDAERICGVMAELFPELKCTVSGVGKIHVSGQEARLADAREFLTKFDALSGPWLIGGLVVVDHTAENNWLHLPRRAAPFGLNGWAVSHRCFNAASPGLAARATMKHPYSPTRVLASGKGSHELDFGSQGYSARIVIEDDTNPEAFLILLKVSCPTGTLETRLRGVPGWSHYIYIGEEESSGLGVWFVLDVEIDWSRDP